MYYLKGDVKRNCIDHVILQIALCTNCKLLFVQTEKITKIG